MTPTLAAIAAGTGATQRRCFASLSAKFASATARTNKDRPGVMMTSEILISPKSSDAPTTMPMMTCLGSRRPLTYIHMPHFRNNIVEYPNKSRCFSSATTPSGSDESNHSCHDRPPVTSFSDDELMVRDLCRQWGDEVLRPVVRDMDEEGRTHPEIIQGLFDCGLMGMVRQDVLYCCHMTCFFAKCTLSVRR